MRRARISSGGVRSGSLFLATGRDGCVATGDVYYGVTPDAMQRRCICTRNACRYSYKGSRIDVCRRAEGLLLENSCKLPVSLGLQCFLELLLHKIRVPGVSHLVH